MTGKIEQQLHNIHQMRDSHSVTQKSNEEGAGAAAASGRIQSHGGTYGIPNPTT
jgi:hypothetical protein